MGSNSAQKPTMQPGIAPARPSVVRPLTYFIPSVVLACMTSPGKEKSVLLESMSRN